MLVYFLWSATLGLKALLISVAVCRRFYRHYIGFYIYLVLTLLVSLTRWYVRGAYEEIYLSFYWWTEFALAAVGFGVTLEIFSNTLRYYPAVRSLARFFVTGAFILLLGQGAVRAATSDLREVVGGVMRFERSMRVLEITLLGLLAILIVYYAIPLGRNVRGLLWGYGLSLISSAVMITLRGHFGPSAQNWLEPLRQASGILTTGLWVAMLWRFHPSPVPAGENLLEADYALAAGRTREAIAHARAQIVRLFYT